MVCGCRSAIAGVVLVFLGTTPFASAAQDEFAKWLQGVWPEARKIGVSRKGFDAAIAGLRPDMTLPDLEAGGAPKPNKAQAEFIRPAGVYLSETQIGALAAPGAKVALRWADTLKRIEQKFGVPGSIVLAIYGRETAYGAEHPTHSVVQVIATEAYAGRRKEYFREQLIWALKMLDEGDITAADFKGSWAGAFGLTQFMPTGYRDNAVDFDGDGKRDVWHSVPDSLASTAMELSKAVDKDGRTVNWQRGMRWGWEVRKPAALDCTLAGYDRPRSVRDWVKLGITRAYDKAFRPDDLDARAYLLLPEGTSGPAFLVTDNFLALKVYNYADLYALFVGHLADRIAGDGPFEGTWGAATHLTEARIFNMQNGLVSQGYDVGKVDGKIGWKMRIAIGEFEKQRKLPVTCYPSESTASAAGKAAAKTP